MVRVGLIGLGTIGSYFCERLLDAGFPLTVLDLDKEKVELAIGRGASAANTPKEAALHSDILLLSLPASEHVKEVMEGPDGLISAIRPGQIILDTGTTRPSLEAYYEQLCNESHAAYLDSPITWRKEGLIFMVGGCKENYERASAVLDAISYKHRYIGRSGSGQMLKQLNQMILANQWGVWSEAIEYSRLTGIDPYLLREYLEFPISEDLYKDNYAGSGQLALHYKDLGYIMETAHETGAFVPFTSYTHQVFKSTRRYGDADWKQAGIITYWKRANAENENAAR